MTFFSSFIKIKEQKKSGGFMHNIFHAAVHQVIFKLGTRFTSMSNGWVIHCLQVMSFLWVLILCRLVTLPVTHGKWCMFRQASATRSYHLTCQNDWRFFGMSQVIFTIYPCVSFSLPTLITISYTLVLCRLMKDKSMPSFDGFHHVDFNTSPKIEI